MTEDQLWERLHAAHRMPYGRGQIASVEEVIRHADALGHKELQLAARMLATSAYTFGAEPAKAFVTFSWCLAAHDRGEADGGIDQLLWHFKWIVNALTKFPELPLDRTHAALDEMERRYRLAGHSMNPVHHYRTVVATHVGDLDTAAEQYRLWCAAPRGELSDCIGCEPTHKVWYLSETGQDEEAVALGLPVLGGQLTCIEQPQAILTELLLPYVRTGRLAEAASAHRQAYRAIQHNRGELRMIADHLAFCAYTANPARGLELLERHLGWLDEPPHPLADMYFSAAAALVLRLVAETGHADLPVRDTTVGVLQEELSRRALELAERFDARNQTSAQGDKIRALLSASPIVDQVPLSGPVRPAPVPAAQPADLPSAPAELVALARQEARLGNQARTRRIWRRFDEVCPQPEPELLAHRLNARGTEAAGADATDAEADWTRAAELFAEAGAEVHRQGVLARLAMLRRLTGRGENFLAELTSTVATVARIGTADDHAQALIRLAYAYRLAEQRQDALAALEQAAELATEDVLRADIALEQAQFTAAEGPDHFGTALALAQRSIELFDAVGPCDGLRRAQRLAAQLFADTGNLERAAELLDAAALADDQLVRAQARHDRGRIGMDLGQVTEAHRALSAAVADFVAVDETLPAAIARIDLAAAALLADAPEEAADTAEAAISELDAARRAGEQSPQLDSELARAQFQLARAYRELGHQDQALELLDLVAADCRRQDNPAGVGQMNAIAGDILDRLDRDQAAAERFGAAADCYGSVDLTVHELENRRRAALSWHWTGDTDRSQATLATAEELAGRVDESEGVWQLAMLGYDGGRILADAGRLTDALERIGPAADRFRALGATVQAAMADALHGRILLNLDRPREAEQLLTAALDALPADATGLRADLQSLLDGITTSTG